jgi:hypothetical protein
VSQEPATAEIDAARERVLAAFQAAAGDPDDGDLAAAADSALLDLDELMRAYDRRARVGDRRPVSGRSAAGQTSAV